MEKVTMGTGVSKYEIKVESIPCEPYGKRVCFLKKYKTDAESLGWTNIYPTQNSSFLWGTPPASSYRCIKYEAGSPSCDGLQTILYNQGIKAISLICRVMGKAESWTFHSVHEAKAEGSSATHIINWGTGEVWYPTIYENTWEGRWHLAEPDLAAQTVSFAEEEGLNPLKWDYTKIRRRAEDALRKAHNQTILECAYTLGVKIN